MKFLNCRESFNLRNKTALVTGATGLLGSYFCSGLAESGANVIVVDLDEEKVSNFAQQLREQHDVSCVGVKCDVADPDSVNKMTETALKLFAKIDILHNNAATKSNNLDDFFAPFEQYSLTQWREIMSVNIDGMFLVAQAIGRTMAGNGGGTIIQTSSIYGVVAPDQRIYKGSFYLNREINTPAVYSTSKAAVIGLTKYLATYWADKKIRVNCLVPGGVESGQNELFKQNYTQKVPMKRMAKPEEMVGALLYLASDASSYVTGQTIIVDGGLCIW